MKFILRLFFLYIILIKIIYNADGVSAGEFKNSNAGVVLAIVMLVFIALIVLRKGKHLPIKKQDLVSRIAMNYYLLGLITSVFSLLPLLSTFRAITGIGYVMVGRIIGYFILKTKYNFYNLLQLVFISGLVGQILFSILYLPFDRVLIVQAGYVGLISTYLAMWNLIDYLINKKTAKFRFFIFYFSITFLLNSFSAFISFFVGLFFIFWYRKNYIFLLLIVIGPSLIFATIINYLTNNADKFILGKKGGAYLTGSGRFDVYEVCINVFKDFDWFESLKGVGFMAERNVLSVYDLTWSIDPHNSFLSTILGLGTVGGIIFIIFLLAPFVLAKKVKNKIGENLFLKWILMHVMFTIYGLTSSTYIGYPSIQLILFIALSYVIFNNRNLKDLISK